MEYERFLIEKWFLTADFSELDSKCQKRIEQWLGPLEDSEEYLFIVGTPKGLMRAEAPYLVLTNKRMLNINPSDEMLLCFYKDITELSMQASNLLGQTPKENQVKLGAVVPTVTIKGTAHKVLHYPPVANMPTGFKARAWNAIRENWIKTKS